MWISLDSLMDDLRARLAVVTSPRPYLLFIRKNRFPTTFHIGYIAL